MDLCLIAEDFDENVDLFWVVGIIKFSVRMIEKIELYFRIFFFNNINLFIMIIDL